MKSCEQQVCTHDGKRGTGRTNGVLGPARAGRAAKTGEEEAALMADKYLQRSCWGKVTFLTIK